MPIRKLTQEDLLAVSALCMDAFMNSVASTLSSEGIRTFQRIASVTDFSKRMKEDNDMLVYEDKGHIKGIVELREGRHVAMLFVAPDAQCQGIGRALISAIIAYSRVNTITVKASLTSVPAYLQYGFKCVGEPAEKSGLKYQPMELALDKST